MTAFGVVSAVAGVLALVATALLWWKQVLPKVMAVTALTASAGISGAVADWMTTGAAWATRTSGDLTGYLFGASVTTVPLVVMVFIFLFDMWPKRHAGRLTAVAGFAIPPLAQFGAAGAVGGLVMTFFGFVTGLVSSGLTALAGV